jgi:allophanate hydrolase subunit 2
MGRPLALRRGSRLDLGATRAGARVYLAVAGGLLADVVLGSSSRHTLADLGTTVTRGSRLACRAAPGQPPRRGWALASATLPRAGQVTTLRYLEAHGNSRPGALHGARFRLGHDGDRMALRLDPVDPDHPAKSPSSAGQSASRTTEPVTFGTIQQPPDGRLAVLLADRQTTGGYPRLGEVASADRSRLAQLPPGALVAFEAIAWTQAVELAVAHERELARLEVAIRLARALP